MKTSKSVSWKTYAHQYDMLLHYNPFYQSLHKEVIDAARQWNIQSGDQIADVGAGTGNYSLSLANLFPQANLIHIDRDEGMNKVTKEKQTALSLKNHLIINSGIDEFDMESQSLQAVVSIHALYTFPDPAQAIDKMYNWLKPGGYAILVDAGRIVNVLNWQIAIGWHLLKNYGFSKTLEILRNGKEVSKQNAYIRNLQRNGTFWTHSHDTFCQEIQQAGFDIKENHLTFRGISDFVVARKPF